MKRRTFQSCSLPRWCLPLLLLCCVLTGCQSTRFGAMVRDAEESAQATLGAPIPIQPIQPTDTEPNPILQTAAREAVEPVPTGQVIDLAAALRIAGVDSPTVALAEEAVRARLAEETQARSLLFPTLNAGTNLRVHRGRFVSGRGVLFDSNLQSVYAGFGADAKGAGTVAVPGVRLVSHLADALYAPRAAEQRVTQSQLTASATRNTVLMNVGIGYLQLAGAQARHDAQRESLTELAEVERLTAAFAAKGQGRDSDAQRARTEQLLAEAELLRRREELDAAAAELANLLDLDPSNHLRAAEAVPPLVELVQSGMPLDALIDQAITRHPEIAAVGAEVAVQVTRMRQERARPLLPVISLGFSAGEFGGGNDRGETRLGNFSSRTDLDIAAVWSLQNLTLGNQAVQQTARVRWRIAVVQQVRLIDSVRRQVTEAYSLTQARRRELDLARNRVEVSQRAHRQEVTRARNLLARPIEVLATINQLAAARQDLIRARVGYSQAQVQLYTALGYEFASMP